MYFNFICWNFMQLVLTRENGMSHYFSCAAVRRASNKGRTVAETSVDIFLASIVALQKSQALVAGFSLAGETPFL
jgi:hypothetical protein